MQGAPYPTPNRPGASARLEVTAQRSCSLNAGCRSSAPSGALHTGARALPEPCAAEQEARGTRPAVQSTRAQVPALHAEAPIKCS